MSGPESVAQTAPVDPLTAGKMRRVILVTYLIAAMDITWLFVQFSITPYLAKRLGFDTLWFGYLQTTVGIIQLLGGPIFGRFADLFRARAALALSCMASVVYFILLGLTNSALMLFIHKLPAIFMHALPGTQMVVADLSEPSQRADALAKLGLCFGIGMIAGSSLGGTLSTRYGDTFAAGVAACGSLFSLGLVLKFIPKHTKKQIAEDGADKKGGAGSVFNLGEIVRLMKFPGVAKTFTVKIVSGLPGGIFQVMFSIIAMNFFQLQAEQTGYLMAYFGVVQMVIQGGVIGRMTARYSESSLLLLSIGVTSMVGLAQALMSNVFQFCLIVVPMMFSLSMFNVITDSVLTKSVPASDTGTMLGLCASVQSLLRTIGPTIGGFLYENYGVPSFGFIQFSVNMLVFLYLLRNDIGRTEERRD
ncbi:solute carrier family 22 member 18 [Megalops cyprinoides]|uniref:solute carrier family 22 member 18 n=1 Tax=Megalops cyprinoides TaxID=118141 RepID=UPI0018649EDB|nr:solute carrier family 22 member 18 [Megalops cyprinoides]XP_036399688.1 solute carrier family 22 member 18 [Megalops cyprinoides]XP_036399689.1 solute carrier family 22 member 18 [Megalops cyprinoides]